MIEWVHRFDCSLEPYLSVNLKTCVCLQIRSSMFRNIALIKLHSLAYIKLTTTLRALYGVSFLFLSLMHNSSTRMCEHLVILCVYTIIARVECSRAHATICLNRTHHRWENESILNTLCSRRSQRNCDFLMSVNLQEKIYVQKVANSGDRIRTCELCLWTTECIKCLMSSLNS